MCEERGFITPHPNMTVSTLTTGTNATLSLSGMHTVFIRGVGGGGGGGYGGTTNDVGGAGGGGGYAEIWLDQDYIKSTGELVQLTYTIGTGGAGGTSNTNNGGNGTVTIVKLGDTNGITLMTCGGGYGAQHGNNYGVGGLGGTASCLGTKGFASEGYAGESGHDMGTQVTNWQGTNGGGSLIGRGGRGSILLTGAPTYANAESGVYGGGGGGGKHGTVGTTTYLDGGSGGDGCVVVVGWTY